MKQLEVSQKLIRSKKILCNIPALRHLMDVGGEKNTLTFSVEDLAEIWAAGVLCVSLPGQQPVNGTNLSLLLFLEAH